MRNIGDGSRLLSRLRAPVLAAVAAAALLGAPTAARADVYKDEKLGFTLNTPKKWKQLPVAGDEKWIVASFQSDRTFRDDDLKKNTFAEHAPKIDIVIIPNSATKEQGPTVEKEGDRVTVTRHESYKDLKEYLDKRLEAFGGGGFHFQKEAQETKIGSWKVLYYEAWIDKLADAPKHVYAWAFYGEDAIYGVVGEGLAKFEEKIKPDIEAAARSFRIVAHRGSLGNETTGKDVVVGRDPTKKTTPEERKKDRDGAFARTLDQTKGKLPAGWKTKETADFVAFSHADDKFTKETLDYAEQLRTWLDKTLGYLGDGIPGKAILRMCADRNEYESMWQTGGFAAFRFEVYTYKDNNTSADQRLWDLNAGIFRIWLSDKNEELRGRMPVWLDMGLRDCVTTAMLKGGKVEPRASKDDDATIAELRRAGKLVKAKDFLSKGTPELREIDHIRLQAEYFTRFLFVGGAQRSAKYKNVFSDYVKNFVAMLADEVKAETDEAKADSAEPQNEQEEDAMYKKRENAWKERERKVLDALLQKTFQGWTDADWEAFDRAYGKEMGE